MSCCSTILGCLLNIIIAHVDGSLLLVETGSSTKLDRELGFAVVSEHTPFGLKICTNISGCLPHMRYAHVDLSLLLVEMTLPRNLIVNMVLLYVSEHVPFVLKNWSTNKTLLIVF